jgi:hypothetical protein
MEYIIKSAIVRRHTPKGLKKIWKRIMLKLTEHNLNYYTLPYQNLIGTIPLEAITELEIVDDVLIVKVGNAQARYQHFKIDDAFELNHWFDIINNKIDHLDNPI